MALEPSRLGGRRFAAGVAAAAVAGAAAVLGMRPPRPRPADIPASEFSAIRAHRVLAALVGDGVSHPEGSPGAAAIRERIASEFRRIGDVPAVRTAFVCDTWGTCGTVSNVVVERPGEAGRKAVLFSAHYDSVSAGPGASDDGMGVAALVEVARALRAAPLRRPTVFLIDDGEEQGLLGARAFADSREATGILADVNLEARGTSGPSFLFETSEGDRWLARLFSRLPHPATSSLFATIYRAMPNDTDLTVFRAHRIAGINFACIGGVVRYHTPRDDVAHADLRTLQHHGENALAMARALDGAPESADGADAVWFDLLGRTVVGWPASATLPAAILVGVLAAAGTALRLRSPAVTVGRFALGLAAVVATVVAAAAAAAAVSAALRTTG
ncbi:MAG TPA: M28 family peptidase, partial [Thermoanaerobaculia bacterium]|nr:M28 family peptidase [Thermoanaerobaculia bacterium]